MQNKVETALFHKPTSDNTLLRADSCHPPRTVKNFPIGEFVHAIRASSTVSHRLGQN